MSSVVAETPVRACSGNPRPILGAGSRGAIHGGWEARQIALGVARLARIRSSLWSDDIHQTNTIACAPSAIRFGMLLPRTGGRHRSYLRRHCGFLLSDKSRRLVFLDRSQVMDLQNNRPRAVGLDTS